jgi:FixJ family two-component response regulator
VTAQMVAGAQTSRAKAVGLVAGLGALERRMLEFIVDGFSLVQIAGELGQSLEDAVRMKARLLNKLEATTTADLVRIGIYAQADSED